MKTRLFTPGPTPVPENVMNQMARPILHHRTAEFSAIFAEASEILKELFQTKEDVYILASSGTGAMEAAVANHLNPGDEVLTIEGGKFGERWGELCEAYGVKATRRAVPWGKAFTPEEMAEELEKKSDYKAVLVTHSETSTGVAIDLEGIAQVVHEKSSALLIVDGITSVGAMPVKMDAWGLDVVVTGSQKGLMIPPGLAFIASSQRAWQAVEKCTQPRYYWDLRKARKSLEGQTTPFTPAVTLVVGLLEALRMIRTEGVEAVWQRHAVLAEATRRALRALGLELLADRPSNAVTAVKIPESLLEAGIDKRLKAKGIIAAGGQGKLKGKIFRISHLGYYDVQDMLAAISVLEEVLREVGWNFEAGIGVKTLQTTFLELTKN